MCVVCHFLSKSSNFSCVVHPSSRALYTHTHTQCGCLAHCMHLNIQYSALHLNIQNKKDFFVDKMPAKIIFHLVLLHLIANIITYIEICNIFVL